MAGSSVTSVLEDCGPNMKLVKLSCTGDASNGTVPTFDFTEYLNTLYGWGLYCVFYDAGSTGPTDASDVTLTGLTTGVDYLNGKGTDFIDNTTSSAIFAGAGGLDGIVPVIENLRQTISNTSVNSATFTLWYVFVRI